MDDETSLCIRIANLCASFVNNETARIYCEQLRPENRMLEYITDYKTNYFKNRN